MLRSRRIDLGPGFLESIYEEALCYEFDLRAIPYERQKPTDVFYKDRKIRGQRVDLLVFGEIVVDLKSARLSHEYFTAQLLSYLRATRLKRGLVINSGLPILATGIKRVSL